jgi:hypothetical protein
MRLPWSTAIAVYTNVAEVALLRSERGVRATEHSVDAAALAFTGVHRNAVRKPWGPGPDARERPVVVGIFASFENVAVDRATRANDHNAAVIDFHRLNALLEPGNGA